MPSPVHASSGGIPKRRGVSWGRGEGCGGRERVSCSIALTLPQCTLTRPPHALSALPQDGFVTVSPLVAMTLKLRDSDATEGRESALVLQLLAASTLSGEFCSRFGVITPLHGCHCSTALLIHCSTSPPP